MQKRVAIVPVIVRYWQREDSYVPRSVECFRFHVWTHFNTENAQILFHDKQLPHHRQRQLVVRNKLNSITWLVLYSVQKHLYNTCSSLRYKINAFLPIPVSVVLCHGSMSCRQTGSGTQFLELRTWRLNCPGQPTRGGTPAWGLGWGLTKFKGKEHRQCTCNVTLRRVCKTIVTV